MRLLELKIDSFKNLKNFKIDFDEKHSHTVLLGENATGKSNFFEALIIILKNLYEENYKNIEFKFSVKYIIKVKSNSRLIEIRNTEGKLEIFLDNQKISLKAFYEKKERYFPNRIFIYYSGTSEKLSKYFDLYEENIELIKNPNLIEEKKFFYVKLIHSKLSLLSFFLFNEDKDDEYRKFLNNYFNIENIEDILFIIKEPSWKGSKKSNEDKNKKKPNFWGAKGIARNILEKLWEKSLAPIFDQDDIEYETDTRKKRTKKEILYLFIPELKKLINISKDYKNSFYFFKVLESMYISDLLYDVKIKFKKNGEKITFRDLSEGEQQLLTVLGLLKFTENKESLILLDEPDTHLNPIWKWKYLDLLREVIGNDETSHIIINTHDPLVIGGLVKEQIRIFKKNHKDGSTIIEKPDIDPKGLGVAGILTSEFFGLPTTLDRETQEKLNRKRHLYAKLITNEITEKEKDEYKKLKKELEEIGFFDQTNDELYNKFLKEISKYNIFQKVELSKEEKEELSKISKSIIEKLLKEQEKK
ncbi:AAA family ATPase [Persephonella sp.]